MKYLYELNNNINITMYGHYCFNKAYKNKNLNMIKYISELRPEIYIITIENDILKDCLI